MTTEPTGGVLGEGLGPDDHSDGTPEPEVRPDGQSGESDLTSDGLGPHEGDTPSSSPAPGSDLEDDGLGRHEGASEAVDTVDGGDLEHDGLGPHEHGTTFEPEEDSPSS